MIKDILERALSHGDNNVHSFCTSPRGKFIFVQVGRKKYTVYRTGSSYLFPMWLRAISLHRHVQYLRHHNLRGPPLLNYNREFLPHFVTNTRAEHGQHFLPRYLS